MSNISITATLPASAITHKIYFLRKTRVMLDSDLAPLYGVTTFNLNKAVRRNIRRFPKDFMFRVTTAELDSLVFQSGISKKKGRGGSRYLPFAFTEHGVAMLSTHEDLRRKIGEMEKRYDSKFHAVFATLRQMLETPIPPKRQIGFHSRTSSV